MAPRRSQATTSLSILFVIFFLQRDVDQEDFGFFQTCITGRGAPLASGCDFADLTGDGHVDNSDFLLFMSCMAGANKPPGC